MLTVGSLFSGIGGLELGLERTGGFRTIWNCEVDEYASAVLRKHWPDVPNLGDITKVDWNGVERPDIICGGFPCQDISIAGKGKGIQEGTRSGLWFEFAKAIRILRPRYVLVENVPMLAQRGLSRVLASLAHDGYDAEWFTLSAAEAGAWHRRERIFIIAHPDGLGRDGEKDAGTLRDVEIGAVGSEGQEGRRLGPEPGHGRDVPNADDRRRVHGQAEIEPAEAGEHAQRQFITSGEDVPDALRLDMEGHRPGGEQITPTYVVEGLSRRHRERNRATLWAAEPGVDRVADGVPNRVDRIKCLGNAVVPQVAEIIGEMIIMREGMTC